MGLSGRRLNLKRILPASPCAGRYSAAGASSCTPSAYGQAATAVGSASCASCAAGTYAAGEGNSDCQPCDVGTYQSATGAQTCLTCPSNSYAHLPGATTCVLCSAGRPADCTQGSCSGTPSAGYHSAAFSAVGSLSSSACAAGQYAVAVAGLTKTCALCAPGEPPARAALPASGAAVLLAARAPATAR